MTNADTFEVGEFAVIGRTFEEYRDMFDLDPGDIDGRAILDCPAGVASFVAEARDRGASAVGVDPVFERAPEGLARECRSDFRATADQIREKPELFDWEYYGTVENRVGYLKDAHERFLRDFSANGDRYVPATLPNLPFADDAFSLTLSANFLFLYSDRLDYEFHLDALRELCRVTSEELRVFPLAGLDTEPYDQLDDVIAALRDEGYDAEIRGVSYEFQEGVSDMLVVAP
ncbi:hypothetical protein ACFQDG_05260 [Natronoarchaeum mannanilyticum]|uniref:SAM-dependent methyltransferase n=1 Tax=Natronoarchaeum mannanilyticum TaxID=926360 RepID=A0AAV3TB83_9EURY